MSKKTLCRCCLLGIQFYIVGYNGTVDWQTEWPERRMSKPHPSSRLHVLRFCMRLCMFTVAAMVSWPFSVDADTGRPPPIVVIVPPVRPPSPPERARAAISHGSLLRRRERLPTDATRAHWGIMHLRYSRRTSSGTSADPSESRYFRNTTAYELNRTHTTSLPALNARCS